jgi:hypothetical protein
MNTLAKPTDRMGENFGHMDQRRWNAGRSGFAIPKERCVKQKKLPMKAAFSSGN